MEPETLLNCGKANRRLHHLVGDKQVWRSLLKGVEDFTEEGLEELVKFVGAKGSSEMKTEVVKEVASRFDIYNPAARHDSYICGKKGEMCMQTSLFKVKVSIEEWGDAPSTFDIGGEGHLRELIRVAQAVGSMFTIKEVKTFEEVPPHMHWPEGIKTSAMIAKHVERQAGRLDKLEVSAYVRLWDAPSRHHQEIFFPLLGASKARKIQCLHIEPDCPEELSWTALAKNPATGHIVSLKFRIFKGKGKRANKEDVRAVWEITGRLVVHTYGYDPMDDQIQIRGGKGD